MEIVAGTCESPMVPEMPDGFAGSTIVTGGLPDPGHGLPWGPCLYTAVPSEWSLRDKPQPEHMPQRPAAGRGGEGRGGKFGYMRSMEVRSVGKILLPAHTHMGGEGRGGEGRGGEGRGGEGRGGEGRGGEGRGGEGRGGRGGEGRGGEGRGGSAMNKAR